MRHRHGLRKLNRTSSHRLAMLRLAIRGNAGFDLSDWEIRQKRVVYTYETLAHFAGSFLGLRTGTKPAPRRYASAGAKMKPRASMPATISIS